MNSLRVNFVPFASSWLLLLLSCFWTGGCVNLLARQAVEAPNLSDARVEHQDATPTQLAELYVSRQFRVPVGPPDASILVWVCDPTSTHESVFLHFVNGHIMARIDRQPATMPVFTSSTKPLPKGTVIMLHGIADNMELGPYVIYREMLVHAGYRVVQVDLRGHGRSTGKWISFGVFESHDMKQVLDELERRNEIVGKVGVWGLSYGGSVAIQWAAIDPRIAAIVALEPFADMRDAALDAAPFVLGKGMWFFSHNDLLRAIDDAGKMAGFNPDDADAVRAIAKIKTPVLIFHSRTDEFISYHQSERLHAAAPGHSRLILLDGDSHFDLWYKSMEPIQFASADWFNHFLAGEPTTQPTTGP